MFKFTFPSGNNLIINLWPLAFILLIGCIISIGVRRVQLKKVISDFRLGNIGKAFFINCEKQKQLYWSKQNRNTHDMLCCILSAAYLEQGDTNAFFQNINALKGVSGETETMVFLLFIQFFGGKAYKEIYTEYEKTEKTKDTRTIVYEMVARQPEMTECFKSKYEAFTNALSQKDVMKILVEFADIIQQGQGDGSVVP